MHPDEINIGCSLLRISTKDDVNNSQSISLLLVTWRPFERLKHFVLVVILKKTFPFHSSQFGFRQMKSTEQAFWFLTSFISLTQYPCLRVQAIFLGIMKALDILEKTILPSKLPRVDIHDNPLVSINFSIISFTVLQNSMLCCIQT